MFLGLKYLTDNYLGDGGSHLTHLDQIRTNYPVTLHGVGMSLGSCDPINMDYLKQLKTLIERTEPYLVSDHLSWSSLGENFFMNYYLYPLQKKLSCML